MASLEQHFAAQMAALAGAVQLILRVLIDKGVITPDELLRLLAAASDAAMKSPGGADAALIVEGIRKVVEARTHKDGGPAPDKGH